MLSTSQLSTSQMKTSNRQKSGFTLMELLTAEQQQRFENGRTLFAAVCAACHQPTGRGLDGLAPPLLDSEWVLGSPEIGRASCRERV